MSNNSIVSLTFLLAGGWMVAGCGDDDAKTEEKAVAPTTIDADGGSVDGGSASATFPAGAVTESIEVAVSAVDVSGAMLPAGFELVSPTIAFTPHGASFESPVGISIEFNSDATSLTFLRLDDEDDTTWEVVAGGEFSAGVGSIDVQTFSVYGIAEGVEAATGEALDCSKVCETQLSAGCANDPTQSECEAKCDMDGGFFPVEGEDCYQEGVAYAVCVTMASASDYECDAEGSSGLKDAVCATELDAFFTCTMYDAGG